ncbi:MAG: hypothetical protein IKF14_02985 [Atopobiaceae bacterium]|nr:hypothetical protein [Atopobiaceae bacterium]
MTHENVLESAGLVLSTLMSSGEFDSQSSAWDAVNDPEVLLAMEELLSPMRARIAITRNRCFLVPTDLSSPFLKNVKKMRDIFRDQEKDEPGRLNLAAVITLLVLHKLLDERSEDALSQAGRGGVVPVQAMVDECEDALKSMARQEGLSDYMQSALDEWERSAQPPTGRPNVNSHEGYVRYVLLGLSRKGVIAVEGASEEGRMATFAPTERLRLQARELLNSERYQEIISQLYGEGE